MHFEENFWSGNDPLAGTLILHSKVTQGQNEHLQVQQLAQELVSAHFAFESAITNIFSKSTWTKLDSSGFGNDDGASLKRAFYQIRDQYKELASEHGTFAKLLQDQISDSLKLWSEETKKIFKAKKFDVESLQKSLDKARLECEKKQNSYITACKNLETLKSNPPPTEEDSTRSPKIGANRRLSTRVPAVQQSSDDIAKMDILLQFGNTSVTEDELCSIITKLQRTYRVVSGDDLFIALQTNFPDFIKSSEDALAFGQGMLDNGFIKLIGRGNKFVSKDSWFYQWNKNSTELYADKILDAQSSVLLADREYRVSVELAEKERMIFERKISEHLSFLQNMEITRISSLKQSLTTLATGLSALSSGSQNASNSMLIALETVNPERDVEFMCENNKTGVIRPYPVIYRSFYESVAKEQIYGVSIVEFCAFHQTEVPWIVQECMNAFDSAMSGTDFTNQLATWMLATEVKVEEIYLARSFLNRASPVTSEMILEKFTNSPQSILAAVRRYFMELPISLIPPDEYDTFKSLYMSKPEDSDALNRIQSVRNIISNIPKEHICSLRYLLRPLNQLMGYEQQNSGKAISWASTPLYQITSGWGGILIQPMHTTSVSALDRHPDRLLKDLILYYDQIFDQEITSLAMSPAEFDQKSTKTKVVNHENLTHNEKLSHKHSKEVNKDLSKTVLDEVPLGSNSQSSSKLLVTTKVNKSDSSFSSSIISPLRAANQDVGISSLLDRNEYTMSGFDSDSEAVDIIDDAHPPVPRRKSSALSLEIKDEESRHTLVDSEQKFETSSVAPEAISDNVESEMKSPLSDEMAVVNFEESESEESSYF